MISDDRKHYLQPDDDESLRRMLGTQELPEALVQEYRLRITMFHRAGGNGPLGHAALVSLCREMGYEPPTLESRKEVTNWGGLSVDGTVRMETDVLDAKVRGVFRGVGPDGTLVMQADGDVVYREVQPIKSRVVEESEEDEAEPEPAPKPSKNGSAPKTRASKGKPTLGPGAKVLILEENGTVEAVVDSVADGELSATVKGEKKPRVVKFEDVQLVE